MKVKQTLIFMIIFSSLLIGCSKKDKNIEPVYTEEEFTKLTADFTVLNPIGENAIPFAEYSKNVNRISSRAFKYKRLRFYAIGFNSVEEARNEAKRMNQYYSHNYMFDQVEGEPVLEDAVIEIFKAQNPNRSVQRVPKKAEHGEGHGESHGETHGESHGEAPAHH